MHPNAFSRHVHMDVFRDDHIPGCIHRTSSSCRCILWSGWWRRNGLGRAASWGFSLQIGLFYKPNSKYIVYCIRKQNTWPTVKDRAMHVIGIKDFDPVALRRQQGLDFSILVHATGSLVTNTSIGHQLFGSVFLQRIAGISTDNGVSLWILVHMSHGSHNCPRKTHQVLVLDLKYDT